MISVGRNTVVLGICCEPLPGVADRSELTSDYSVQLAIVIYTRLWEKMFWLQAAWLVLVIVHFTHNPQSINRLVL